MSERYRAFPNDYMIRYAVGVWNYYQQSFTPQHYISERCIKDKEKVILIPQEQFEVLLKWLSEYIKITTSKDKS